MKIKNQFNAHLFKYKGEINDEPSATIPDQTLTIREILTRYSRGLPIDQKIPVYDESEEYFPDPRYMDLAERQEYAEMYKEELQAYQERTKRQQTDGKTDVKTTSDSE